MVRCARGCKGPNTSKKHPQHRIYPSLLRNLPIRRPSHIWCSDITNIPVRRGVLHLVAIIDWATRKVLAWRRSNTPDASFCVEASNEAITKYGKPEIMNTDQGAQFTAAGWITTLNEAEIKISMPLDDFPNHLPLREGRGRYLPTRDHAAHNSAGQWINIFIEHLRRSLKQQAVNLHEVQDGFQARRVIKDGISFYTNGRPHTALNKRSPNAFFDAEPPLKAA
ncbi:DDE-type integrase/transposase/recombinase [Pseudophaeobacter sp.]|uniref:DDE-type integrase/transposase/recombinase n=1 Tax=Pseudophaeobacter sp. TaxID=1971739 RepID=UPI003298F072